MCLQPVMTCHVLPEHSTRHRPASHLDSAVKPTQDTINDQHRISQSNLLVCLPRGHGCLLRRLLISILKHESGTVSVQSQQNAHLKSG